MIIQPWSWQKYIHLWEVKHGIWNVALCVGMYDLGKLTDQQCYSKLFEGCIVTRTWTLLGTKKIMPSRGYYIYHKLLSKEESRKPSLGHIWSSVNFCCLFLTSMSSMSISLFKLRKSGEGGSENVSKTWIVSF